MGHPGEFYHSATWRPVSHFWAERAHCVIAGGCNNLFLYFKATSGRCLHECCLYRSNLCIHSILLFLVEHCATIYSRKGRSEVSGALATRSMEHVVVRVWCFLWSSAVVTLWNWDRRKFILIKVYGLLCSDWYTILRTQSVNYSVLRYSIFGPPVFEYSVLEYSVLEYLVLEYLVLEYSVFEYSVLEYSVLGTPITLYSNYFILSSQTLCIQLHKCTYIHLYSQTIIYF